MPTYDYECQRCKHVFEVFQSMSDKHLEKCPKCKGKLKRLISPGAGIIFKGSGSCEKATSSCPSNCKHKHK